MFGKIKTGVLRGGPSSEYEISLKTGANVLRALPEKYQPVDIFISREGVWHLDGVERRPERILSNVDVIFNAMHGEFGEDGQVQEILDRFGAPYAGSRNLASRLAMNKALAKSFLAKEEIKTPFYKVLGKGDVTPEAAAEIFRMFSQPSMIKPLSLGSSLGISIARNFFEFEEALRKAFEHADSVIIEEFIPGREATCGVVENLRGERYNALPPVEIISESLSGFFDYEAKYQGKSREICPGNFKENEISELRLMAERVHKILGLRHYSRSDFIVNPKRGIYFLETNTLPGLTNESLLPKSLAAIGVGIPEFLDHVLTMAMEDGKVVPNFI